MHASRKRHSHLESDWSTSYEWTVTRGHSVGVRPTIWFRSLGYRRFCKCVEHRIVSKVKRKRGSHFVGDCEKVGDNHLMLCGKYFAVCVITATGVV